MSNKLDPLRVQPPRTKGTKPKKNKINGSGTFLILRTALINRREKLGLPASLLRFHGFE
jgi:hypothetical protein